MRTEKIYKRMFIYFLETINVARIFLHGDWGAVNLNHPHIIWALRTVVLSLIYASHVRLISCVIVNNIYIYIHSYIFYIVITKFNMLKHDWNTAVYMYLHVKYFLFFIHCIINCHTSMNSIKIIYN